jgi:hypothetical protein
VIPAVITQPRAIARQDRVIQYTLLPVTSTQVGVYWIAWSAGR